MVIFGTFAFVSGALVFLFLPETLGQPLPETIAEAINFHADVGVEEPDESTPLISSN